MEERGGGCAAPWCLPCHPGDNANLKVIMGVRNSYIDDGVLETDNSIMGC